MYFAMTKSLQLNRRTALKAAGVTLALPWLEAMANEKTAERELPRRMCAILFPFGTALIDDYPGFLFMQRLRL